MTAALRQHLGKICHIYLDDIIIWSQTAEEHIKNVCTILQALKDACMYCNPKKLKLFCTEILFLGHRISEQGIEANKSKTEKIMSWPVLKSATQVCSFLGLVRYIAMFLPDLATHTLILMELTHKEYEKKFPLWTDHYQGAFNSIKELVTSQKCLTTIDYEKMPENKIFVTTDASDIRSGAMLSFGKDWEMV